MTRDQLKTLLWQHKGNLPAVAQALDKGLRAVYHLIRELALDGELAALRVAYPVRKGRPVGATDRFPRAPGSGRPLGSRDTFPRTRRQNSAV